MRENSYIQNRSVQLEVKDDDIPLSKADGSGISFFIDLTTERELKNIKGFLRNDAATDRQHYVDIIKFCMDTIHFENAGLSVKVVSIFEKFICTKMC